LADRVNRALPGYEDGESRSSRRQCDLADQRWQLSG